jgi:hypothetical protein
MLRSLLAVSPRQPVSELPINAGPLARHLQSTDLP